MSTRAVIEQVLRKHFPSLFERDPGGEINYDPINNASHDLLALLERPQPSMKELDSILRTHGIWSPEHGVMLAKLDGTIEQLKTKLMAWAQGETRREWCQHLRPASNPAHPNDDYDFLPHLSVVTLKWTLCPICNTPRPPEIP